MSFFKQSELHCTSQDVCLRFSPVGKSISFDQIFDEIDRIHFSNRQGRNTNFEFSEPRFFQFDGGSFGYIKEVGAQWISKFIELFGPSKLELDDVVDSRQKRRRRKMKTRQNRLRSNEESM